jgi:hypothetical protein
MVPKIIMTSLVINTQTRLQEILNSELHKEELYDSLLNENKNVSTKRVQCRKDIEFLKQAREILSEAQEMA